MANTWSQPLSTDFIYSITASQLGPGIQFVESDGDSPSEADILALAEYLANSAAFTNVALSKITQTGKALSVDLTAETPNFDEPTE